MLLSNMHKEGVVSSLLFVPLCMSLLLSVALANAVDSKNQYKSGRKIALVPVQTGLVQTWPASEDPIKKLIDDGRFQEAIQLATKELSKPDIAKVQKDQLYAHLAKCFDKLGQTSKALQAINRVPPDSLDYNPIKVQILIDAHRYREALSLCDTWSYVWHHDEEPLLFQSSIYLKLGNKRRAAQTAILAYKRCFRFRANYVTGASLGSRENRVRLSACSRAMVAAGLKPPTGITVTGNSNLYVWNILTRIRQLHEFPPRPKDKKAKQTKVHNFYDELSEDRPDVLLHLGYVDIDDGRQELFMALAPDLCTITLNDIRKNTSGLTIGGDDGEFLSIIIVGSEKLRYQDISKVRKTVFFFTSDEPHFLRQILVLWYPTSGQMKEYPKYQSGMEVIAF